MPDKTLKILLYHMKEGLNNYLITGDLKWLKQAQKAEARIIELNSNPNQMWVTEGSI
ncbi:hypothetical protein [Metabacillus fastidiosus]|uniref:hypothetical protein n=1 Tax=Metabacillus fastidiosus TaxID=1458 RepID=UPI002E1D3FB1|nr:hypothetical protein [Metabacillus fastidiosus]